MRIKHVPYTKKNVTTIDLVVGDEILYRDEDYFNKVQDEVEEAYLDQVRNLTNLNPVISEEETKPEVTKTNNNNSKMTAPLEEHAETGPLVPCKVCNRTFLQDRISKHAEVCHKTTGKQRPVYDVVGARVQGTDAGEMVTMGKIKLEPARPLEKKSELMKKYNTENDAKTDQADQKAAPKAKDKDGMKLAESKNGAAFQVMFDGSQNMKMQKPSTAFSKSKLPPIVHKQQAQDLRKLSAKNWKRQRNQVSPDFNSSQTSFSEEDEDFLASSMVSTKTVCSDAFDFLFDEKNLNPEDALHKEFNRQSSTITHDPCIENDPNKKLVTQNESSCCVIS